jgi:uncharacterized membrane protein
MTDESPQHAPTPPGSSAGSPTATHLVIMFFGGIALAIGGCAVALSGSWENLARFGTVFLVGVAITITSVVVAVRATEGWWKVLLIFAFILAVVVLFALSLFR